MMKNAASSRAAGTTCRICRMLKVLKTTAAKSVSSARPLRMAYPTGCCIQPLAVRIQIADRLLAPATSHITAACALRESFFQPKTQTPISVDSRKKAAVASMASSEPKMSPTYAEYPDQLVPNWNSSVMPVTTPTAKLIRNSLPQNFVIFRSVSSPVRA